MQNGYPPPDVDPRPDPCQNVENGAPEGPDRAVEVKESILVVDDDIGLGELLVTYLGRFGYQVTAESDPQAAMARLDRETFQLVILDVMLPGIDGFTLLRRLRETSSLPVIMLTACGDLADRVVGLELGADDYLSKPFEPRELLARVRSLLRRASGTGKEAAPPAGLHLLPERKEANLDGVTLDLTPMEFDLLEMLAAHRGRVLSRDFIMDRLKGYEWEAYDRSIDIAVSRLRAKLGDSAASPRFIKTVRGSGYLFIG